MLAKDTSPLMPIYVNGVLDKFVIIFVNRPDYLELGFADIYPLNPVEIVMELVLQEVDLIVAWAYKVPGFRELDQNDQASLVSTGTKRIILKLLRPVCSISSMWRLKPHEDNHTSTYIN